MDVQQRQVDLQHDLQNHRLVCSGFYNIFRWKKHGGLRYCCWWCRLKHAISRCKSVKRVLIALCLILGVEDQNPKLGTEFCPKLGQKSLARMKNVSLTPFAVLSDTLVFRQDYWSITRGTPSKDATQNLKLIKVNEAGGHTNVEFERDAETGDDKDVQFRVSLNFERTYKLKGRTS